MAAIDLACRFAVYTRASIELLTFVLGTDDIADIMLELSEREIYNDIRASCDITEILSIRPDATPEFFDTYEAYTGSYSLPAGQTLDLTASAEEGMSEVTWLDITEVGCSHVGYRGLTEAECHAIDSDAQWWIPAVAYPSDSICKLPSSYILSDLTYAIIYRGTDSVTVRVANNSSYDARVSFRIGYMAMSSERRYINYRTTDNDSIVKYGRRTMNLIWALGMHPVTMQQMIEDYLERYSEPVPILTITVQGKTDRLASWILGAKINDKVRIEQSGLGINHEFWINQMMPIHRVDGMLECDFTLEQVRSSEQYVLFELDTSILDGDHVLAP